MIVADVNLIVYLIMGGPDGVHAQRILRHDPVWCAPLLWRSEFRNVLAAYIRQRDLDIADAWRAHQLAGELLAGREYTVSGEQVLGLIAASKCSAYDCEYVALADELDVPLVTADRELLRAFPGQTVSIREFAA
mgnify:CR=1 FL=1